MTPTTLVTSLLKDKSNGARRIIQKPGLLEPLNAIHLETLLQRFETYTPNTAGGQANRAAVIDILVRRKEQMELGAEAPTRKDNLDRSRMMSEHTAVLFIKVTQPGMRACIDPEEFVAKERGEEAEAAETDDEVEAAAGVDPKRHVVMQKLFGKDYVNPLFLNRLAFMSWLKQRCVPSTFLAGDHLLIPRVLMGEVTDKIDELILQRNVLLNEFEARYEEAKADSRLRLGVHYDEARYPAFKELREKFKVNFMWRTLDVPSSLKDISKAHYAREKAKARIEWENTFEVVRDGLRVGFQELVGGFAVALGAGEDGKPRVFKASKVEQLRDFLKTFEARDLTNDDDLAALAGQAREIVEGVDPATVRKDLSFRQGLETQFKAIAREAGKLTEKRVRKLMLDD